jgi:hypothetical protein
MLCLVPHLFPSARLLGTAAQDLRLPALEFLLARGTRLPCPADGVEAALCEALGIERQHDWPLAPITLAADGGDPRDGYWLRADPVHLRVMRDRVVLADSELLELSREEADALAGAVAKHFGAELAPLPLHPQRWYLRLPDAPRLVTTPLSLAVGRDIEPLQPHGADARPLRTRLNELQMLLHDHPVNQAREARGALPVNSLWLWGGGRLPAAPAKTPPLHGVDPEMQALAAFCGARAHPLPAHPNAPLMKTDGVVLLDALTRPGQAGDAYGWRAALGELERDWFAPLARQLRRSGPRGVQLADPVNGQAVSLRAHDAWRFWRRPRALASMLS